MKTKILSILVLTAFFSTSCTDLDEKLYDKVTTDDYGKTAAEIQTIVGGAYATLRGFNDSDKGGTISFPTCEYVFFLEECASDEATIPTRGTDWYDGGRYQQIQYHTWNANNIMILSAWKYCYQGIANVNSIIYQVDKSNLTDDDKAIVKAELRGIRAYYYYQLLDQFGSVPIVTSFEESELPAKSSRADVFKFVEDELKDILDKLPSTIRYGGFTQNVANSLLARLYLNAEVYTGIPRWQDCINASEKVTGYILESDYFTSFKTKNETSREIIFAIPYDHKEGTVGNYLASMTFHYNQRFAFSTTGAYPWCGNGISAQPGLYSSFDENDVRRGSLLIGEQKNLATGATVMMDNGNPLIYTEDFTKYTNALQNEGARLFKYQIQADDQWERDNDWVLIRYAEILMMKAEANFRLGFAANALIYVNEIRNRAGLPSLTTLTLESLDTEWKHEFVFEGLRRTTNIRFGTFFKPWWEKGVTPAFRGVYPIPQTVLDLNPNLKQNPDYN
ncbi:RagB/SusD family nutrient uptake outer membrane protein [Dysgonomonas sp. HGC4]|uniref:RagB/SusD family nutrient uptake outer membrane protein n=1 Tax=Dysgonomonas sp. HGC4 TaxID=1658009 RepID=UPI0006815634|nr:RagB/SusD family nutrient uptake outer membrane protein [Dysgonomonas sp. HGC4]MBD8349245.1 RagB/SusD family nutrient uptake outer membrane protein [Dysgonomonas sp. HGC4]